MALNKLLVRVFRNSEAVLIPGGLTRHLPNVKRLAYRILLQVLDHGIRLCGRQRSLPFEGIHLGKLVLETLDLKDLALIGRITVGSVFV